MSGLHSLVWLVWRDSVNHGGGRWGEASKYRESQTVEGMTHESVGWVLCEDKSSITIYGDRGTENPDDPQIARVMQIPKGAIVSRHDLRTAP